MDEKEKEINTELSVTAILGEPENAFEMVNKYGTYEIQPTSDTDNEFPAIAQGNPKKTKSKNHSVNQKK
ncbi:MAG: hypothetical protein ACI39F_01920 [Acutalibacteraceae bacterium]